METKLRRIIAKSIRELRKSRTMTQGEFAEILGVDQATLSRIENGEVDPRFKHLDRIVEHFGITPERLILGDLGSDKVQSEVETFLQSETGKTLLKNQMEALKEGANRN